MCSLPMKVTTPGLQNTCNERDVPGRTSTCEMVITISCPVYFQMLGPFLSGKLPQEALTPNGTSRISCSYSRSIDILTCWFFVATHLALKSMYGFQTVLRFRSGLQSSIKQRVCCIHLAGDQSEAHRVLPIAEGPRGNVQNLPKP